jgi:conjugative transposon TraM protein
MLRLSETNKGKSYLVKRQEDTSIFSLMGSRGNGSKENRFYGLDDELGTPALQNTLLGIIPEKQILTTGATVKIRLLADILVSKTLVPRGQFIYGTASLNNERLKINISSIACNKLILPVSLSVYDLDGMEGIYVPGSIDRDASKQSASDAVNTLGLASPDASFGAQAASVGIEAAKTLMSKKIRLVRVTLKEGYQILLKDNNQK